MDGGLPSRIKAKIDFITSQSFSNASKAIWNSKNLPQLLLQLKFLRKLLVCINCSGNYWWNFIAFIQVHANRCDGKHELVFMSYKRNWGWRESFARETIPFSKNSCHKITNWKSNFSQLAPFSSYTFLLIFFFPFLLFFFFLFPLSLHSSSPFISSLCFLQFYFFELLRSLKSNTAYV